MDSTVFDNFIYRLLVYVRESPEFIGRRVVLLMDNASIHHHRRVIDTVLRFKVILLFSAQLLTMAQSSREILQVP